MGLTTICNGGEDPPRESTMVKRMKSPRRLVALAVFAIVAMSAFGFAAANTMPANTRAGDGSFTLNWGRPSTESFYIAINSEPLRWKPEFAHDSPGKWQIVVPLWVVGAVALVAAGTFCAWSGVRVPCRRPPIGRQL